MTSQNESMADLSEWAAKRVEASRRLRRGLMNTRPGAGAEPGADRTGRFVQKGGIGAGAGLAHKAHLDTMKDKAANPGSDSAADDREHKAQTSESKKEVGWRTSAKFNLNPLFPTATIKRVKKTNTTEDTVKTTGAGQEGGCRESARRR